MGKVFHSIILSSLLLVLASVGAAKGGELSAFVLSEAVYPLRGVEEGVEWVYSQGSNLFYGFKATDEGIRVWAFDPSSRSMRWSASSFLPISAAFSVDGYFAWRGGLSLLVRSRLGQLLYLDLYWVDELGRWARYPLAASGSDEVLYGLARGSGLLGCVALVRSPGSPMSVSSLFDRAQVSLILPSGEQVFSSFSGGPLTDGVVGISLYPIGEALVAALEVGDRVRLYRFRASVNRRDVLVESLGEAKRALLSPDQPVEVEGVYLLGPSDEILLVGEEGSLANLGRAADLFPKAWPALELFQASDAVFALAPSKEGFSLWGARAEWGRLSPPRAFGAFPYRPRVIHSAVGALVVEEGGDPRSLYALEPEGLREVARLPRSASPVAFQRRRDLLLVELSRGGRPWTLVEGSGLSFLVPSPLGRVFVLGDRAMVLEGNSYREGLRVSSDLEVGVGGSSSFSLSSGGELLLVEGGAGKRGAPGSGLQDISLRGSLPPGPLRSFEFGGASYLWGSDGTLYALRSAPGGLELEGLGVFEVVLEDHHLGLWAVGEELSLFGPGARRVLSPFRPGEARVLAAQGGRLLVELDREVVLFGVRALEGEVSLFRVASVRREGRVEGACLVGDELWLWMGDGVRVYRLGATGLELAFEEGDLPLEAGPFPRSSGFCWISRGKLVSLLRVGGDFYRPLDRALPGGWISYLQDGSFLYLVFEDGVLRVELDSGEVLDRIYLMPDLLHPVAAGGGRLLFLGDRLMLFSLSSMAALSSSGLLMLPDQPVVSLTARVGEVAVFPFSFLNSSGSARSISLVLSGPGSGVFSLSDRELLLSPGERKEVELSLLSPEVGDFGVALEVPEIGRRVKVWGRVEPREVSPGVQLFALKPVGEGSWGEGHLLVMSFRSRPSSVRMVYEGGRLWIGEISVEVGEGGFSFLAVDGKAKGPALSSGLPVEISVADGSELDRDPRPGWVEVLVRSERAKPLQAQPTGCSVGFSPWLIGLALLVSLWR